MVSFCQHISQKGKEGGKQSFIFPLIDRDIFDMIDVYVIYKMGKS